MLEFLYFVNELLSKNYVYLNLQIILQVMNNLINVLLLYLEVNLVLNDSHFLSLIK
jgi:hypothetical protein